MMDRSLHDMEGIDQEKRALKIELDQLKYIIKDLLYNMRGKIK